MVMNLTYCPYDATNDRRTLKGFKEGIHLCLIFVLKVVT